MLFLVQNKWYDREEFWSDLYVFDTCLDANEFIKDCEEIDWEESVAFEYRVVEVESEL